jgi:hypothetical protein
MKQEAATLSAFDPAKNAVTLERHDGETTDWRPRQSRADQHLRDEHIQTAYAAQGLTAERVMINADSRAANLAGRTMMHSAGSAARPAAAVDNAHTAKLITARI